MKCHPVFWKKKNKVNCLSSAELAKRVLKILCWRLDVMVEILHWLEKAGYKVYQSLEDV